MKSDFLRTSVVLFCMIAIFVYGSLSYSAPPETGPIIHFRQTTHTFPTVFEGTELTHTFVVSNKGTATLNIKKVTHSWGCFAARYDRAIPPGGTGNITLSIDTSSVRGEFEKKAIVWSNDLKRRSIALYLTGEVKPHISIEPGGYLSLWGVKGQVPRENIDIVNNHDKPLKINCIESDLKDHVRWTLKEVKSGYVYRLEVVDISKTTGDYAGHLYVRTDNPLKPELVIIINGHVSEK